jgi:hypothetical protein
MIFLQPKAANPLAAEPQIVNQFPGTPGHIDDTSVSWKFASHLDAHEIFPSPTYKFSSKDQTAIDQRSQAVQFNRLSSQRQREFRITRTQ